MTGWSKFRGADPPTRSPPRVNFSRICENSSFQEQAVSHASFLPAALPGPAALGGPGGRGGSGVGGPLQGGARGGAGGRSSAEAGGTRANTLGRRARLGHPLRKRRCRPGRPSQLPTPLAARLLRLPRLSQAMGCGPPAVSTFSSVYRRQRRRAKHSEAAAVNYNLGDRS